MYHNVSNMKSEMAAYISEEIKGETVSHGRKLRKDSDNVNSEPVISASSCEKLMVKCFNKFIDIFVPMLEHVDTVHCNNHTKVMQEIEVVKNDVIDTQIEADKSSQYNRRENIRIYNVPVPKLEPGEKREDTNKTVIKTLNAAGANPPLQIEDIYVSHRLPTRDNKGKPDPIIVKWARRDVRNRIMFNKKAIKDHQNTKQNAPDLFIVEDLTPLRNHISYQLRQDDNIAHVWSIDGKIKCLKKGFQPQDKPITIDTPFDLQKLNWSSDKIQTFFPKKSYKKQEANSN